MGARPQAADVNGMWRDLGGEVTGEAPRRRNRL